jgi:hypothetical protein
MDDLLNLELNPLTLLKGHPAHKKSGALTGYSLSNGIIYIFMSWFGILALMQSLTNQATIGPIVLFVGLMMNEEVLNFIPSRHYAAYIIGLFPSIYDWVVNVSGMSPIEDFATGGNEKLTGLSGWFGVLAWKRGALLVSFIWTAMLVKVIDRQWFFAVIWALLGAFFALFGIIHVPEAGFENFTSPTWEQCVSSTECWEHAMQWQFMVAYLMLAATFAIIGAVQKWGGDDKMLPAIIDKEAEEAFKDWFKDAAVDPHPSPHNPKYQEWLVSQELLAEEHGIAGEFTKPIKALDKPDTVEPEEFLKHDDISDEIDA